MHGDLEQSMYEMMHLSFGYQFALVGCQHGLLSFLF